MNTRALKFIVQLMGALCVVGLLMSCDKKCQPPSPQPAQTITANPWRLIKTTNPSITNLNRFTFLIMSFKSDFEGDVLKVVNNKQFDTPILTFKFNIETSGRSGQLRIVYSSVVADDGSGQQQQGETSDPVDYDYRLSNKLVLTEVKTGYSYEYIPFAGIVDPDSNCTF